MKEEKAIKSQRGNLDLYVLLQLNYIDILINNK